jgi:hypothetical protein
MACLAACQLAQQQRLRADMSNPQLCFTHKQLLKHLIAQYVA